MGDSSWQIELTRPLWLAALAVLPLLVIYWRRGLVHFARWQQATSLAVRSLLVVVLVAALCGIKVTGLGRQQFTVFAVDQSASISQQSANIVETFLDEAVSLGGESRTPRLPFAALPGGDADRQGSDIAAAIAAARALIPAAYVPQIVLLSDGNQTAGDALAAAVIAGVPISTVPLPGCPEDEVYVAAVHAKAQVRRGEPFYVEVVVQSTHDGEGTVQLLRGRQTVSKQRKRLGAGENRLRFRQAVADRPVVTFTAELDGFRDTIAENNRAGCVVFVTARPRVLLVESQPVLASHLAEALQREDIDVEVRPPQGMPQRLEDLQNYELLILSNVPAASLPDERMQLVKRYVGEFGGGLIVVGGDRAFTPGGYRNTTLEEVLPVICEPKKQKRKPSLAMVLVIDRSGSMKGESIELAKQATRQAVEKLHARDKVGVIAFEDQTHWISQIHPCSDKQHVLGRIDTIEAGGGTNMYPAMEKAYLALYEAFADLKHMIVLTDGASHHGDFERLSREIAAAGITVSTVGVGREAVLPLLEEIAEIGKGHHYFCAKAADVPKIFVLEAASAGREGITEEPFTPQVAQSADVLSDLDFSQAPTLLGFVETRPRPSSQVILTSEQGDPLLVWRHYGAGVSVAFTSDIRSRWAAAWLRWPGFGRFWAQLVRHAMRKDEARDFGLTAARRGGRVDVTLEAVDPQGRFLNAAEASLDIIDPRQTGRETTFVQVAPGRYAVDFAAPERGTYYLQTTLKYGGRLTYIGRRGLVVGYADELRVRPTNEALLRSIAEATGGRYDPRPADVLVSPQRTVPRTTPLWPYLLAAAALIFLADVVLKRIDFSRSDKREAL